MIPATIPEHVQVTDGQTVSCYIRRVPHEGSTWHISGWPLLWPKSLREFIAVVHLYDGRAFIEPKNFDPEAVLREFAAP